MKALGQNIGGNYIELLSVTLVACCSFELHYCTKIVLELFEQSGRIENVLAFFQTDGFSEFEMWSSTCSYELQTNLIDKQLSSQ